MLDLDYVVIGHVTRDLTDAGPLVGGTATYSALTAMRLGRKVGVVTSASADLDLPSLLRGAQVIVLDSPVDTTFQNVYYPEGRVQFLRSIACQIGVGDVPPEWFDSPILHLAPVAAEMDYGLIHRARNKIVGVTPQGWLRGRDGTGKVSYKPWEMTPDLMMRISVLVVSEEDIADDPRFIPECQGKIAVLVVTQGSNGARVFVAGQWHQLPAYPARVVDPTGAGDVFAAAYLVAYDESADALAATNFANCAASFAVEKLGIEGIPTRTQIEQRLNRMVH